MAYRHIDDVIHPPLRWDSLRLDADLDEISGLSSDFSVPGNAKPTGRERKHNVHASTTSKGTGTRRIGLDPFSRPPGEIPSLREATSAREVAERNVDVSKWLAGTKLDEVDKVYLCTLCPPRAKSRIWPRADNFRYHLKRAHKFVCRPEDLTPFEIPVNYLIAPTERPEYESTAIDTSGRDGTDTVTTGHGTENQAKPYQTFFIEEHGGPMIEEDYRMILASRNWGDTPVLPSISRPGASRYQPQSSQAAIERFNSLWNDGDSVISRAATWGTRRRSLSSITDLNLEQVTSGNVLKKLSLNTDDNGKSSRSKRASILQDLRDIVTKPSRNTLIKSFRSHPGRSRVGHEEKTTTWGEDKTAAVGTHLSWQSASRKNSLSSTSGARNSLSITSSPVAWSQGKSEAPQSFFPVVAAGKQPTPGNRAAMFGGPPIPNSDQVATKINDEEEDDEGGDYMKEDTGFKNDSHLIDDIMPNSDGFQQYLIILNPSLAQNNQFLIDRISHQQVDRYKHLLITRLKHSGLKASCSSGSVCVAMGGSAKRLEPRDVEGQSDTASFLSGASDDKDNTLVGGKTTQETFPDDIPLPPTDYLPAEIECQLCFERKKLYKAADWRKHVHEDVQPFTCTWENCKEPMMFKRKADWVRHENERHRQLEWWRCDVEDCAHICFRRDNFVQHLVREHKFPEPRIITSGDMKRFGKEPDQDRTTERVNSCRKQSMKNPEDEPCRFCGKRFWAWKKLTTHLAKHMEQIALPVLRLVEAKAREIETNTILPHTHDTPLVPPTAHVMNPLSSGLTMISKGPKRDSWDSGYNEMSGTSITSSDDAIRSFDNSLSQTGSTLSSKSPFRINEIQTPFSEFTCELSSPRLLKLKEESFEDDEHMKGSQDRGPDFNDDGLVGIVMNGHSATGPSMLPSYMKPPTTLTSTWESCMEHIQRLYPYMNDKNIPLASRLAFLINGRLNTLQLTRRLHRRKTHNSECPSSKLCSSNDQCFRWRARKMASDSYSLMRRDLTIPEEMSIWVYDLDMPSSMRAHLPVELECPICFNLQTFHTPDDWKAHIMADLAPYTCTNPSSCKPMTFDTVSSWLGHEQSHGDLLSLWQCNIGSCELSYHQRDLFIQHLVQQHDFPEPTRSTGSSIKITSSTISKADDCQIKPHHPTYGTRVCYFCGIKFETQGERDLHHAQHMESVGRLILSILRETKDDEASILSGTHSIPPTTSLSGGVGDLGTHPLHLMPTSLSQESHRIQGNIPLLPVGKPTSNIAMGDPLAGSGPQALPNSVSEKGDNEATESPPDAAVPLLISQEKGEEDTTGNDALEPLLEAPCETSDPMTPRCAKIQSDGAPEGNDAEMVDAEPENSTPSTDTNSTTEDARPQARWQSARRLRQIGVAQIRIEKVSLSHSLYVPDSSEESEWYDEDLEEVDNDGDYIKNTDQSEYDQQKPGSGDHPTEKQSDQNIHGSQSNKRKRQVSQDKEGTSGTDDEEDGEQPNSTARPSKSNCAEATKRWACPFQVHDEQLGCLQKSQKNPNGGCDSISRLKQHLNRKHRRSLRCERCWRSFDTKQKMASHGAQKYPCKIKKMSTDERFMYSEAEDEMDKPCRMASYADTWYHLFRHVIPGMTAWDTSVIRQQFSPYYTYKEPIVTLPSINFPASALYLNQGEGQGSPDSLGALPDQQFQSLTVPMFGVEGNGPFNADSCFSFNPFASDTTPSEASMIEASLMSNVPSAFSAPSTGMSFAEPNSGDANLRQSYDRMRAHNQRLLDDSLRNVRAVAQIQGMVEDLLHAGGLNDQAKSTVIEISSLLGRLKKGLV